LAGKKVQVPVLGGIRKSILIPNNQGTGTTIDGFAGQLVTIAQLQLALGVTVAKPNTQGSGGAASTGSIVPGQGLSGGGPLVGPVTVRLSAPIPAFVFEEGGGGGDGDPGPPGINGVAGAAGAVGPIGPAGPSGGPVGPAGVATFLAGNDGEDGDVGPPGAKGLTGATGPAGPAGPSIIWVPEDYYADDPIVVGAVAAPVASSTTPTLLSVMLADGPVALWKCDDASSALADSGGGGYNLTTVNGSVNYQYSPLIIGAAAALANVGGAAALAAANGWQASVGLGVALPFTTWTLELTIAPLGTVANNTRIFDFRVGSSSLVITVLLLSGQFQVYWNAGASPVFTGPTLAVNTPYHFFLTCSTISGTSTLTLYQPPVGIVTSTATASASTASGGSPVVTIGGSSANGTTDAFNIGYVALYPSVLSKSRIAAHIAAAGM